MKRYGGVDVWIHVFFSFTSALFEGRIRGLPGPGIGLGDVENRKFLTLPGLEPQPLGRLSWLLVRESTFSGRAITQAVSRRLPTAAARVQIRVWSCGIL
jgi:hypothetical protein